MERIDTAVIDKIRDGLINRYDKDQQMQQLIEEIGAEEGLNEQELAIVYQAYLEVKERMQYTANLVELWNQIETVQHRMELLHTYDSLENDLLGDDATNSNEFAHSGAQLFNGLSDESNRGNTYDIGESKPLGYGAGKGADHNYTMEQVELHEVEPVTMDTVFDEATLDDTHNDTSNSNHIDPFDLMTAMFAEDARQSKKDRKHEFASHSHYKKDKKSKSDKKDKLSKEDKLAKKLAKQEKQEKEWHRADKSEDRSKEQKKIDKLLKKQMKRIEKEWAKISGKLDKDEKKSKSKEDKIAKKAAKEAEKALAKQEKWAKQAAKAAKKAEKQELKKSGKKKKA